MPITDTSGKNLPVMETFYSIQGEGANTGKAAFFLRIGGCDVGCYWCDVKESWNAGLHPLRDVDEIVEEALGYAGRSVVVTGGEPLLYNLNYLTSSFIAKGFVLFLETSGSEPLSGTWNWICLSPKRKAPPQPEILMNANELKVIIFEEADFEWARSFVSLVKPECLLYIQPEWSRCEKMMPSLVEFVMKNPSWMISLQSHKYMRIP